MKTMQQSWGTSAQKIGIRIEFTVSFDLMNFPSLVYLLIVTKTNFLLFFSQFLQVLHYMSIGILSVFMVEIMVKMFAFRLAFFKHKMEVFDALVVVVAFALDVAFAAEEGIQSAVGLLVVLRLWRVTRILNGM